MGRKKRNRSAVSPEPVIAEINQGCEAEEGENDSQSSQDNNEGRINDLPEWLKTLREIIHGLDKWRTEIKKIDKQDITILTTVCGALIVLIRLMWYFYMLGYFQIYGINSIYIQPKDESILYKVIRFLLIAFVMIFTNFVAYYLFKKKKVLLLIFELIIIELISIVAFILLTHEKLDFIGFLQMIKIGIVPFLLTTFILMFFGIYYGCFEIWDKRNEAGGTASSNTRIIGNVSRDPLVKGIISGIILLIMMSLMIFCSYWWGGDAAHGKKAYMVIFETIEGTGTQATYTFQIATPSDAFAVYPITYETQTQYFVARLVNESGAVLIDYDYQKIIEKKGIETYRIYDIYDIDKIKERYSALK